MTELDPATIFFAAFELYRAQFEALETKLNSRNEVVTAEVSIEVERDWRHATIYTADFVVRKTNDGSAGITEVVPARRVAFPPFSFVLNTATIHVEKLVWDRVRFSLPDGLPDLAALDPVLGSWHWDWETMDLPRSEGVIHSICRGDKWVEIDFGSAPPSAMYDVLDALVSTGVKEIRIDSDFKDN
ncbi:MAG: hypothetical protein ACFB03_00410 [Paracoccaceae bacterium]